jgi:hypothetical protein
MNSLELLCDLEEELKDKRGLLSRKDGMRCMTIIQELKSAIPMEIEEANYIISKQKEILKNADIVAKKTLRAAEEKADHLVGTTDVLRKAESDAKNMLDKTSIKCDLLIKKTKEHLDALFVETEQFLLSTLSVIRTNRQELRDALLRKNN